MQEFNVLGLLSKYSGEIIVCVAISCVISFVLKHYLKLSNKIFIILSLFIGFAVYLILSVFLLESSMLVRLTNAVTCGALSLTIAMCFKRFAFMDKSDIKSLLEKLLSSIVLSDELDNVVDEILQKMSAYGEQTKDCLREILKDNLNSNLTDEELETVIAFIISACDLDKNNDKK